MKASDFTSEAAFGTTPKRTAREGSRPARGHNPEPRYKSGSTPDRKHMINALAKHHGWDVSHLELAKDHELAAEYGKIAEMDGDGAGRDGSNRKSHSTYGSRDKHNVPDGPDVHLGAKHTMKRKDITKHAGDVLNKEFDKSHKGVAEIAGAFPSPSTREKWAKDAAASNAAEAKRQAALQAQADAKRIAVNTPQVDRLNKVNYHGANAPKPSNATWDGDSDFLELDGTKYAKASRMPIPGGEAPDMKLIVTQEGWQVYIWTRNSLKGVVGRYFFPAEKPNTVQEGKMSASSRGRRDGKQGKPLAPPYHKDSSDYSEYEKGWNEYDDIRKKHNLAPYNKKGVEEGEVVQFPKKHRGDLEDTHDCPKCGGDLQGGKYMGYQVKVCMPCKQVYLPPNSGIDQQGNKIKDEGVAEGDIERQHGDIKPWAYWNSPERVAQKLYKIHNGNPIGKDEVKHLWKVDGPDRMTKFMLKPDMAEILSAYQQMSDQGPLFHEDSDQRKQNALWAQISDYEKKAKTTKDPIRHQHYLKMADKLRGELKTSDNEAMMEHKKGVKAIIYNKKPKPVAGPEAFKANQKKREEAKKKPAAPKAPKKVDAHLGEGAGYPGVSPDTKCSSCGTPYEKHFRFDAEGNILSTTVRGMCGRPENFKPVAEQACGECGQIHEHGKASLSLCKSSKPDSELGASMLASCKSQGLRARDGNKSHKLGKGPESRVKVGGHRIKGHKYGGPLPDWS